MSVPSVVDREFLNNVTWSNDHANLKLAAVLMMVNHEVRDLSLFAQDSHDSNREGICEGASTVNDHHVDEVLNVVERHRRFGFFNLFAGADGWHDLIIHSETFNEGTDLQVDRDGAAA